MPQRDGTGPSGKGAGTGRGQGNCSTKKSGCLGVLVFGLAGLFLWLATLG